MFSSVSSYRPSLPNVNRSQSKQREGVFITGKDAQIIDGALGHMAFKAMPHGMQRDAFLERLAMFTGFVMDTLQYGTNDLIELTGLKYEPKDLSLTLHFADNLGEVPPVVQQRGMQQVGLSNEKPKQHSTQLGLGDISHFFEQESPSNEASPEETPSLYQKLCLDLIKVFGDHTLNHRTLGSAFFGPN
jgi:hypothetical protein